MSHQIFNLKMLPFVLVIKKSLGRQFQQNIRQNISVRGPFFASLDGCFACQLVTWWIAQLSPHFVCLNDGVTDVTDVRSPGQWGCFQCRQDVLSRDVLSRDAYNS